MKSFLCLVGDWFFVELIFEFSYGVNICIGNYFYVNYGVMLCDEGFIMIGNDCKFGFKVGLYMFVYLLDLIVWWIEVEWIVLIMIGNDVWIGGSVVILFGVMLGNNVIVGVGVVVIYLFLDNVIVVGNLVCVLK